MERSFICLFYDESQNRTQKEKRKVVFLLAVLTRSAWRTPRLRGSPCYCSASPCALTVCTLQKDDPGCHPDPEQIPELLRTKKFQQSRRAAVLIQKFYRSYKKCGKRRQARRTAVIVQQKLRWVEIWGQPGEPRLGRKSSPLQTCGSVCTGSEAFCSDVPPAV